jgi:hypothetical protein
VGQETETKQRKNELPMKLTEIAVYSAKKYTSEAGDFLEETLKTAAHPDILIQMFAWDGVVFLDDYPEKIEDWDNIKDDIKGKLNRLLLSTYGSIKNGKNPPDSNGHYTLTNVLFNSIVEDGGVSIPDYDELKRISTAVETILYF